MVEINNFLKCLFDSSKKNCFNKGFFYFLFDKKNDLCQLKMNIDTKCLVLSHYPGAETRGLGGFIAQYPKNFEVLCFTNGNTVKSGEDAQNVNLLKQNFTNVMKMTRVKGHKVFDINTNTLKEHYSTFKKIDISEADYIFIPNIYDRNEDAIALIEHFSKLIKEKEHKKTLKIFMYECDFCLCTTNFYVNISSIIETKKKMLKEYYPEAVSLKTVEKLIGLNAFRSINLGSDYAEMFMGFAVEDFLNIPLV